MRFKLVCLLLLVGLTAFAQAFPHTITVTITNGESLSAAISVREGTHPQGACTPSAIIMPSAWTTANLTFQVSVDGTTFQDLYDEYGSEVQVTAAASRTIRMNPADWWNVGLSYKIRSGTTGTPVTQGGTRTLKLICR